MFMMTKRPKDLGLGHRMTSESLTRMSDRDLRDLGLSRYDVSSTPDHAPVEVPNDRT